MIIIKMIEMSLNHQWFKMTDDDGNAVNCEQKSADCVYDLLRRFEKLRVETEHQGVREHLESLVRSGSLSDEAAEQIFNHEIEQAETK